MDKMRPLTWLTALGLLAFVLSGCHPAASKPAGFAIYLVKGGEAAAGVDLARLELEPTPFLSQNNLISYNWATHAIELTEAARQRVARLEVPVTTGVPFVVCVGAERIYSGAFWVSYSSMSYNGIVIDTLPAQAGSPLLRLQLGYPESLELFAIPDPRPDPRIQQSLMEAGKLR